MNLTQTDKDDVRQIVREEIAGSSVISGMQREIDRTAGLMENLDSKFDHVTELLNNSFNVKSKVDNHEGRITGLEKDNQLIRPTVALHSRQLKSLTS